MRLLLTALVAYGTAQSTTESPQAALEEVEHEYKSALHKGNETLKSLKEWLEELQTRRVSPAKRLKTQLKMAQHGLSSQGIESSASKTGEVDEVASKIKRLAL